MNSNDITYPCNHGNEGNFHIDKSFAQIYGWGISWNNEWCLRYKNHMAMNS